MAVSDNERETLVLDLLYREPALRLDQVIERLPQLTWNQVFQTVDALSRCGAILVRRQGFEYEVSSRRWDSREACCATGPL
jgi:hypothetical protein